MLLTKDRVKTILLFAVCIAAIFLSCGLEQGYILYNIDPDTIEPLSVEDGKTGFSYKGENSSFTAFIGFELYYKFFAADAEYSNRDSFTTNPQYVDLKTTIEEEISNSKSLLTQNGFLRVRRTDKTSLPLISISNKSGSYNIVIDMITNTLDAQINVSGDENYTFIIKRSIQNNGTYLSFRDLTIGQEDFKNSGSNYYLSLVVMAYGVDESLNNIYSKAVFLKPIKVTP